MYTSTTKILSLSNLQPGNDLRDGDVDVGDLVESFRHGLPQLQNLVVRRLGAGERYQVLAGHRRLAAAKKLGWRHLEARIVEANDEQAELIGLEENLRRRALPDEAAAMARLVKLYEKRTPARRGGDRRSQKFQSGQVDRPGLGAMERAAKVSGKSVRETRRLARIGRLGVVELRSALAHGDINVLDAEKIAGLPPKQQRRRVRAVQRDRRQDPGVRRALEALAYVGRVLDGIRPGTLPIATALEFGERLAQARRALRACRRSP